VVRPAQSRAVLPAMKPGTARAFALRRRAHRRASGPESLSLGSLGISINLTIGGSTQLPKLPRASGAVFREALTQQDPVSREIREVERHGQLHEQRVARFFEEAPLALVFKGGNPRGKKSAPHTAIAR
jgi:hypothetical protein